MPRQPAVDICPYCHGGSIHRGIYDNDRSAIRIYVRCHSCNREWQLHYESTAWWPIDRYSGVLIGHDPIPLPDEFIHAGAGI